MLGNGIVHGMHNPATVWSSDTSLRFDGVNDHAKFPLAKATSDTNRLANSMHISLWLNVRGLESSVDPTIFMLNEDAVDEAYLMVWYDTSAGQIKVTRTDTEGLNPVTLSHGYVEGLIVGSFTNIHVEVRDDAMTIHTLSSDGSSASTGAGSGEWDDGKVMTIWLGSNLAGGNGPLDGRISNLAVWRSVEAPDSIEVADVFNNGEPKNELETTNASLFLYYTASEKNFEDNGVSHIVTYTQHEDKKMVLSGAFITDNG